MDITGTNSGETLDGTADADNIYGLGGDDFLNGKEGNDNLDGGEGNDTLDGGTGIDTLTGGLGDDLFFVYPFNDTIVEAVGGGRDYAVFSPVQGYMGSYALNAGAEVELISTYDNNSTDPMGLLGNEFSQAIVGNAGNNYLQGMGGQDILVGLGGNDGIVVDADDIVIEAIGGGYDNVSASTDYILNAGAEIEVISCGGATLVTPINVTGNEFGQIILGNQGKNYIDGGGGVDTLIGGQGDDSYIVDADDTVSEATGASAGFDIVAAKVSYTLGAGVAVEVLSTTDNAGTAAINLTGNEFSQSVLGNAGANILDGRGGNDLLVGRGGADTFAFTTAPAAGNVDTIGDFSAADDTISLDDAVFAALSLGALNPNAFVIGSAAADADDRIIYNSATGQLFYDADGNGAGAQVQFATLAGAPAITAADFVVI